MQCDRTPAMPAPPQRTAPLGVAATPWLQAPHASRRATVAIPSVAARHAQLVRSQPPLARQIPVMPALHQ